MHGVAQFRTLAKQTMPKRPKCLEADLPHPGSVFLAPLSDGKFGVLRVLKTKTQSGIASAFVAASPWIGSTPIRPSDHEIRLPLFLTHHSYNGQIAGLWVFTPPPPSFIPLGDIDIDAEEDVIERETYSRWESISMQILVQWRWDNDREALLIEEATRKAQETEERKIAAERRAAMLRTLTLDSVSERVWFDSWDEESDGSCLTESRRVVSSLIKSLRTSPKITKAGRFAWVYCAWCRSVRGVR